MFGWFLPTTPERAGTADKYWSQCVNTGQKAKENNLEVGGKKENCNCIMMFRTGPSEKEGLGRLCKDRPW